MSTDIDLLELLPARNGPEVPTQPSANRPCTCTADTATGTCSTGYTCLVTWR